MSPGLKRWHLHLVYVGEEGGPMHGAVEHHGGGRSAQPQCAEEGGGLPVSIGHRRVSVMAVQSRLRGHVRVCDILRSDRGESTRESPSGPAAANSNQGKGGFGDAGEQTSSCLSVTLTAPARDVCSQYVLHEGGHGYGVQGCIARAWSERRGVSAEAFGTEEQCRAALVRLRCSPDGFVCPCCGHRGHCVLAGRGRLSMQPVQEADIAHGGHDRSTRPSCR